MRELACSRTKNSIPRPWSDARSRRLAVSCTSKFAIIAVCTTAIDLAGLSADHREAEDAVVIFSDKRLHEAFGLAGRLRLSNRASRGEGEKVADQARALRERFSGSVSMHIGIRPLTPKAIGDFTPLNELLGRHETFSQIARRNHRDHDQMELKTVRRWRSPRISYCESAKRSRNAYALTNFADIRACAAIVPNCGRCATICARRCRIRFCWQERRAAIEPSRLLIALDSRTPVSCSRRTRVLSMRQSAQSCSRTRYSAPRWAIV